jgi:N-acetylneuraminic acid mutarotase
MQRLLMGPQLYYLVEQIDCKFILIYNFNIKSSQMFNDVWLFDTLTQRWTEIEAHSEAPPRRHGHTLTLVSDIIYLFGGYGSGGRLSDTWKLDPVLLNWSLLDFAGAKPSRRSHHSAVGLRNKLIIFGGLGSSAAQDLWQLDICMKYHFS